MVAPWTFQFVRPEFLWLFLLLALLGAWVLVGSRRRLRDWKRMGQGGQPSRSGALTWLLVMALVIIALARPRWGRDPDAGLEPGYDVILVLDVSRSMAVEDAWPDRLGVAIRSVESLVQALGRESGNRVGIVAFAGRAVVRCPLTANLGAVSKILSGLRAGSVEPGGSQISPALEASLALLERERPGPEPGRFIVIVSDGEFHEQDPTWRALIPRLQALRVPVHTLAVGDLEQGHPVPVPTTSEGSRPLTYQGEIVLSQRSDDALRSISQATGGAFLPVGLKPVDLGKLYRDRIEPEVRRQREPGPLDERSDRFPIFLAIAIALSIAALWPRVRRPALAFGLITIGLVAASSASVSEAIQRGQAAYEQGDFNTALAEFERAIALRPEHPLPRYDAAAALYQLQRFDEAEVRYREASQGADDLLQGKINYALGNLAFVQGDYRAAVSHYDRCLVEVSDAPEFQRLRADALQNRAEAIRRIPPEPDDPKSSEPKPEGDEPGSSEASKRAPDDMAEPSDSPTSPGPGGASSTSEPTDDQSPGNSDGLEAEVTESESPEDQLARAIANIQQAKQRRPTRPDLFKADESRKDW